MELWSEAIALYIIYGHVGRSPQIVWAPDHLIPHIHRTKYHVRGGTTYLYEVYVVRGKSGTRYIREL